MKVNDNFLIVMDEQGFYRLLKRDNEDLFSIVVAKVKSENKDAAKQKFEEMNLIQ